MRQGAVSITASLDSALSADWLLVTDSPWACIYTDIPRERRIVFLMEPPEVTRYRMSYLEQFGIIVSPYDIPQLTGRVVISPPCIGWFAGSSAFKTIDDAMSYPLPKKTREISMVTSMKRRIPGRKKRLALMDALTSALGSRFDRFGAGILPIEDKLDGIAPYRYHVAIENSRHEHYWTEKLVDAWIGWALPIYCGDPSILDRIPDARGIELIDTDDISGSVRRVIDILAEDPYEQRIDAIKACREWAIANANPYERTCDIIAGAGEAARSVPRLAEPEMLRIVMKGMRAMTLDAAEMALGKGIADRSFATYCRIKHRTWA